MLRTKEVAVFDKVNPTLLHKSLKTYMPSLYTEVVQPPNGYAKWGLRVHIPDSDHVDVFTSRGQWHWYAGLGMPYPTMVADSSGMQTISAFVARHVAEDIMVTFGTDHNGRLLPSASRNYAIAAKICGEAMGFLAALAMRQIPFTDNADAMARAALEQIEATYAK